MLPQAERPTARCGGTGLCRQCRYEATLLEALRRLYSTDTEAELRRMVDDALTMLPTVLPQ